MSRGGSLCEALSLWCPDFKLKMGVILFFMITKNGLINSKPHSEPSQTEELRNSDSCLYIIRNMHERKSPKSTLSLMSPIKVPGR